MRAPVTVAPVFQDAGNAYAAPARRQLATSIDTTDWRGCGLYDASYSTCHSFRTLDFDEMPADEV